MMREFPNARGKGATAMLALRAAETVLLFPIAWQLLRLIEWVAALMNVTSVAIGSVPESLTRVIDMLRIAKPVYIAVAAVCLALEVTGLIGLFMIRAGKNGAVPLRIDHTARLVLLVLLPLAGIAALCFGTDAHLALICLIAVLVIFLIEFTYQTEICRYLKKENGLSRFAAGIGLARAVFAIALIVGGIIYPGYIDSHITSTVYRTILTPLRAEWMLFYMGGFFAINAARQCLIAACTRKA